MVLDEPLIDIPLSTQRACYNSNVQLILTKYLGNHGVVTEHLHLTRLAVNQDGRPTNQHQCCHLGLFRGLVSTVIPLKAHSIR